MRTWKFYYLSVMSILCATFFVSCGDGDEPEPPIIDPVDPSALVDGIFFLNSGNYAGNDASLDFLNRMADNPAVQHGLFSARNSRKLGDTANDLIAYGSRLYIAVSGSKTVEIATLDGASVKQLRFDGDPRYLASDGGKVYITLFDGHVARLDTVTLEVDKTVSVGRNPEQLVVAGGKLYVANSGGLDYASETGYDHTVSVIDLATFTETKKIEVGINPSIIVADKDDEVYVASMGNYADVPSILQRIDRNDRVTVVDGIHAGEMVCTGERIYILSSQYDENWVSTYAFISFDAVQESILSTRFVEAGSEPPTPYKISADLLTGNIYITSSDYVNSGDVYEYDAQGKLTAHWEAGLNPIKTVVVRR